MRDLQNTRSRSWSHSQQDLVPRSIMHKSTSFMCFASANRYSDHLFKGNTLILMLSETPSLQSHLKCRSNEKDLPRSSGFGRPGRPQKCLWTLES